MALFNKIAIILLILEVNCKAGELRNQKIDHPRQLPSYQGILDLQFSCDKEKFNNLGWDPSHSFVLAPKAWSVISDLKVKELPPKQQEKLGPNRSFEVSFRGIAYFECGSPVLGLDERNGKPLLFHEIISHAYRKLQYLDWTDDDPPESYIEGWPNFISNGRSTDIEPPPDTMGEVCLVTLDQLLANPQAIDLDKLCAGESKEKREFTKKEISKVIAVLKKRQAEKQKKSSKK